MPFNVGERILDFVGLGLQHIQVLAVDTDDDWLRRASQNLLHPLAEIGLHVAIEARIVVSNLLHASKGLVKVSFWIDTDPILAEIGSDDLLHDQGLPDVGAGVADAGDGAQSRWRRGW